VFIEMIIECLEMIICFYTVFRGDYRVFRDD